MMRYVLTIKIISIQELKRQINWRKDSADNSIYDEVSVGWSLRFDNSSAIHFSERPPEWNVGDVIKLTLEKV